MLHTCDNKRCVNPNHLYLGSQQDNMRDRFARGRANIAVGERHGFAKFTEAQVRYIRGSEKGVCELARKFGVWHGAISKIRLRKNWKHI